MGVFPSLRDMRESTEGLPHTRGGVSALSDSLSSFCRSSPHTWGCFRAEVRDRVKHMVFPTHVGCFLKPYSPPAPLLPCSRPYPAKTAERATPANAGFGKALSNHPATGNPPRRSCGKSGVWAAWLQALPVPAFRAGAEASLPVWAARRAFLPLRPAPHVGR